MPEDSPLFIELYSNWAKFASSNGDYELAAKCWIKAESPSEAAAMLAKRKDPKVLKSAAMLFKRAGNQQKAELLEAQCVQLGGQETSDVLTELGEQAGNVSEKTEKKLEDESSKPKEDEEKLVNVEEIQLNSAGEE